MKSNVLILSIVVSFFLLPEFVSASKSEKSAKNIVVELYELVTFPKGSTPDWNPVKELFIQEAIIVLRSSRTEMKTMNLDGFVADFQHFIESANVVNTGFSETILKIDGQTFGETAWFSVLFRAEIPGTERRNVGIDHFSLIKKDGEWKIVSIVNEVVSDENPVPNNLKD